MSAPPPLSAEPSQEDLQKADALKTKGNAFFGNKDYKNALEIYSSAIRHNPKSHVLYSNRSAAHLQLNNTDEALKDAEMAVSVNPYWGKAHRRRGNVLEVMGRLDEAIEAYNDAKNFENDTNAKNDLKRTIASVKKRQEKIISQGAGISGFQDMKIDEAPTKIISREFERRVQSGEMPGVWPPVGSCTRRLWLADLEWTKALQLLSTFKKVPLPPGANAPPGAYGVSGQLQTLAELTSAALEDVRACYFSQSDFKHLELCYMLEQHQRDAIGPDLNEKEVIQAYKQRIDSGRGWDQVRPALQLSIRSALMNGLVASNLGNTRQQEACKYFRRAIKILEEARRVFIDVEPHIRGRTLEITFLRGIKVRLCESLIKQYNETAPSDPSMLPEILEIGDWLIDSCAKDPLPYEHVPPRGPQFDQFWGTYTAHWGYPKAMGHSFRAMYYMQQGLIFNKMTLNSKTGKKGPTVGSTKDLMMAAEEYIKAAAWLPEDDPDGTVCLWYAIYCIVRRGCYYLADLTAIRSVALAATNLWSPYFSSSYIPPNHVGKMASSEALRQSEGAMPETICSPLFEWPDGVAVDQDILGEISMPYMSTTIALPESEGGGMLLLGKILQEEWKKRAELGVPEIKDLWGELSPLISKDWDSVLEIYEQEKKHPSGVKSARLRG